MPEDVDYVWAHHTDTASDWFVEFSERYLDGKLRLNHLRDSFVNECFSSGMNAKQESCLAGHSPEVAERHYSLYEAKEAVHLLPPDPLQKATGPQMVTVGHVFQDTFEKDDAISLGGA